MLPPEKTFSCGFGGEMDRTIFVASLFPKLLTIYIVNVSMAYHLNGYACLNIPQNVSIQLIYLCFNYKHTCLDSKIKFQL